MSSAPAELVRRAAAGEADAWDALIERFHPLVWRVARSHGLDAATAADVTQTTWLRLVENLDRLREPSRVNAWLVTTARREALAVLRVGGRSVPAPDLGDDVAAPPSDAPEAHVEEAARNDVLHAAFAQLGEACRLLLGLLCASPPLSYEEVSATLDMPIGSIGPTRARCLDKLRAMVPAGITWA